MMKQSYTLLYLLLKKQLKRIPYVVLLIVMPIIISILINSNVLSTTNKNIVGLYCNGNDRIAEEAIDTLLDGNYQVQFVDYEDRNEMLNDITNGRIDCGYEFDENLTDKIISKYQDTVILYLNDSDSLVASYTNELIFSAVLNAGAYDLLIEYANNEDYLNNQEAISIIDSEFQSYVINKDVFSVQREEVTDNGIEVFDIDRLNSTASVRSLAGIVVMLTSLIGAITRAGVIKNESFEIMRKSVLRLSSFIYPLAYALPVTASMVIILLLTGSSYGPIDILNITALLLASVAFAGFLSLIIHNSKMLAGAVPNILMICIFIYPVIFDLIMFSPVLKWIRFLLPPQYINLFN